MQNTSYLTFFLPPITFPHAKPTCLFHSYPNPLALGEADLRLVRPSPQLPSCEQTLPLLQILASQSLVCCVLGKQTSFGNTYRPVNEPPALGSPRPLTYSLAQDGVSTAVYLSVSDTLMYVRLPYVRN